MAARRWIAKVSFRDREKWLPAVVVTVEAGTIFAAMGRAAAAGKKKSPMNGRRIYEMTVNLKPAATLDDRMGD